jgi:hypothetical protein
MEFVGNHAAGGCPGVKFSFAISHYAIHISLTIIGRVKKLIYLVRLQVLMAANMKMTVIWDVALCSLIETDRHFRGFYCLHHQGDE